MFKIISDGEVIALCDEPLYIRLKPESGAYVKAKTPEQRQGISVNGTPYNLPGHTEIERVVFDEESETNSTETAPEATAVYVDSGTIAFTQGEKIAEVDETSTTGLLAVTDLYEELLDKGVL